MERDLHSASVLSNFLKLKFVSKYFHIPNIMKDKYTYECKELNKFTEKRVEDTLV